MSRHERLSMQVAGLLFLVWAALLGLWLIPRQVLVPGTVESVVLSPRFWPYAIAVFTAFVALLALLQGRRPADAAASDDPPGAAAWPRFIAVAVLLALYAASIEPIGVVIASAAFVVLASVLCRRPLSPGVVVWSVALPWALASFFSNFIGVMFPVWPGVGA